MNFGRLSQLRGVAYMDALEDNTQLRDVLEFLDEARRLLGGVSILYGDSFNPIDQDQIDDFIRNTRSGR